MATKGTLPRSAAGASAIVPLVPSHIGVPHSTAAMLLPLTLLLLRVLSHTHSIPILYLWSTLGLSTLIPYKIYGSWLFYFRRSSLFVCPQLDEHAVVNELV